MASSVILIEAYVFPPSAARGPTPCRCTVPGDNLVRGDCKELVAEYEARSASIGHKASAVGAAPPSTLCVCGLVSAELAVFS